MFNNASYSRIMNQTTNTILMVRPTCFAYNIETASNNYYQKNISGLSGSQVQEKALYEFDKFVRKLKEASINVIVFEDLKKSKTPDSIFPNNWISTHDDGSIFLYPMFAQNRRDERRSDIIQFLKDHFYVKNIFDNTVFYEKNNLFLEGTGSMIFDRTSRIAYACISERTNEELFKEWCLRMNFTPVSFSATQLVKKKKQLIYHTNVMMCIADRFAIVCLKSISSNLERNKVINSLRISGKEIIDITEDQKNKFAGNMLQLMGDKPYLVMSNSAFNSLTKYQIKQINKYCSIIYSSLDTIEACGGGSARCMIAEVFLQKKI